MFSFQQMSDYWKLNVPDWIKTLVMVVLGAFVGVIEQAIESGGVINAALFSAAWHGALIAGLAYLGKQLGTSSTGATFGIQKTAVTPKQ